MWWSKKQQSDSNVVNWAYDDEKYSWLRSFTLLALPPEPVLSYYYKGNAAHFMKCPSWKAALQNVFAIRSPIDVELTYDRSDPANKRMNVIHPEKAHKEMRSELLNPRFGENSPGSREVMSLNSTPYVFYSDASVVMELLPPFMEWDNPNNVRVNAGQFNIGKWRRSVEYAVELQHSKGVFRLKRGDVMFYIKLTLEADTHARVKLEEKPISPELRLEMEQNTQMKYAYGKCPLHQLYNLRAAFNARKRK